MSEILIPLRQRCVAHPFIERRMGAVWSFWLTFPGLVATAIAIACLMALPAHAQQSLGLSPNSDEPIDIQSDSVELDQRAQTVTFVGQVIAVQGDSRLRSDRLRITYEDQQGGGRAITDLYATGNVVITSGEDQTATGQWARYERGKEVMTMGDKVTLSQGDNVLEGSLLTMDLKTDQSRLKGTGSGQGRVRGLFTPEETEAP